jgi:hypothetical protein
LLWAGLKRIVTFLFFQKYSNEFELIRSKDRLPVLENFQINCGFERN